MHFFLRKIIKMANCQFNSIQFSFICFHLTIHKKQKCAFQSSEKWGFTSQNISFILRDHFLQVKKYWRKEILFTRILALMALFEKLMSDWNQTWFIDIIWEPSYVHGVKGHM